MSGTSQVAIIGAGPYGLSLGAHLRARGVDFRIFGKPMHSWRAQMPAGMFLKSEPFASNLYDPRHGCTLQQFYVQHGLTYRDHGVAVPLETFTSYGLWFQEQLVPGVEDKTVVALRQAPGGFELELANDEIVRARRVVVAVGAGHFRYIPPCLGQLPPELLSHSADHHDLSGFKGRDVSVIGAGASALDLVADLRRVGATVRLVARRHALKWNTPASRPAWKSWYPMSGLGGGWRNRFYENAPMVYRRLPPDVRARIVRTWLGPSGAWPVKDSIDGTPLLLGHVPKRAESRNGRAALRLACSDGSECDISTEHVIAATGYRVDLRNVSFLGPSMLSQLRVFQQAPVLSPDFQSSLPGLYFAGLAAANTFGPVMRFVLGARFTARRLSRHLARASVH
jgi:lysine/ornithine N-monooxygenase